MAANPVMTWDIIKNKLSKCVSVADKIQKGISRNPNVTFEIIRDNECPLYDLIMDAGWDWPNISINSSITWDVIISKSLIWESWFPAIKF